MTFGTCSTVAVLDFAVKLSTVDLLAVIFNVILVNLHSG